MLLTDLERALAPHGLNLIGATTPEAYDARVPPAHALGPRVPGARAVIVIGNGGGAFWTAYRAFCRRHPGHESSPDPLDDYTRLVIERAIGGGYAVFYPFGFPSEPVSFTRLAECAGLGRPSLVGVLVHPVFGPWIALRAAVAVPFPFTAPRPADGFDPCPGCVERSCIVACPAGAVGDAGWDVGSCAVARSAEPDPCAARCHARWDCVIGRAHRYPPDAFEHHQTRARPALLTPVTIPGAPGAPGRAPVRVRTPRA